MEPTTLLPIVSLLSPVSVEYSGWSLLGFLTGRGQLGEFREQFFRAGYAHAGVLLVLSLVYFLYLGRTGSSTGVQWIAGLLLLAGIIAQSGGFFLHMGLGRKNRSSLGTVVTRTGALLIAAALVMLATGLL
jgi:heme/copper-type cytochrome/quinol oxidase subunit 4